MTKQKKQTKGKSSGRTSKTDKSSAKTNKSEVTIYGGVVKCGERERNNWAFWSIWKELDEYGDQKCADEEEIPPKYRDLNHMDAALRWEEIFKDATKRLWLHARTELELFDIPNSDREKVKDCIAAYMNNVEQSGHEINAIMEEFASGDFHGDQDDFARKVMKKMFYGIYVQICWAMNATKDCVREVIVDNGFPLSKNGSGGDEDSALAILKLLKDGEIGKGELKDTTVEEAKLRMLQLCPFNDEVVAYCYLDDGGKGPINDVAREAKIDMKKLGERLLLESDRENSISTQSTGRVNRTANAKNVKKSSHGETNIAKESKQIKSAGNSSKSSAGEIAIYGGIVKSGLAEYANWSFWSFWKDLSGYGDEKCVEEEKTPPKYRNITPDEAAHNWKTILEDAEEDLKRHVEWELKLFDLPEDCHKKVANLMSKLLKNVENTGHEIDEMMENFVSGEYDDKERYADAIKRKLYFGIFIKICSSINSTKNFLRQVIEENGWTLSESDVSADEESASAILKLLKEGKIGKGKFADASREEAKLKMLQLCPFNKDVVSYCYLDDNGKGPINDVARAARVDVSPLKKELLKKMAGEADLSTEDSAQDYRDRLVKASEELELDVSGELAEVDSTLKRLDREYRTVDGREFSTRDEADKQKKLSAFELKLDLSSEEAAIDAKAKLEKFIKKLGVDGLWKMNRVAKALECFDKQAKRAGDRIFETREEAAKQRELVDFEKSGKITDEASALRLKSDIIALAKRLGIDGTWKLERVNSELKRFDKLARTAFGMEYQTREEAAAKRDSTEAFLAAIETAITSSDDNGFYFKDRIPSKKLVGARTYLSGAQDDGVFAIVDTTILGSAKIGLAVSRWGIVWKNDTVKTARNAYSWKELALLTSPSKPDRGEITFEKGVVFDFTNSNGNADACRDTLVKMVAFAKEATCLDRLSAVKTIGQSADTFDMSIFTKQPCDCLFVERNIPEKKLHNAFISMKVQEPIESVRLLIDSTVFGSAKEGLLVTNNAIYSKNFMEDPIRVTFESVESVEAKKNAITINSKTCQLINITTDVLEAVCGYIKAVSQAKGGK